METGASRIDVRQGDEEGDHQRHFHRHEEDADDIGGDHLPAPWQAGEQRLGEQRVQILGPVKKAEKNDQDREQRANQPVAQFDQVRQERGFLAVRVVLGGAPGLPIRRPSSAHALSDGLAEASPSAGASEAIDSFPAAMAGDSGAASARFAPASGEA